MKLLAVVIISVLLAGCQKELTGPEYNISGSRRISFLVDPISSYYPGELFAASPSDIWFSSSSGLYKFNGSGYELFTEIKNLNMGGPAPNDIWGLSTYDGLRIYHYNGSDWTEYTRPITLDSTVNTIKFVKAVNKQDVYASGQLYDGSSQSSILLQWNGTDWKYIHSNSEYYYNDLIAEPRNPEVLYIYAQHQITGKYVLLKLEFGILSIIYTSDKSFSTTFLNGELLIFKSNKLCRINGEVYKSFHHPAYMSQISVVSENDIFFIGYNPYSNKRSLYHYNGTDIAALVEIHNPFFLTATRHLVIACGWGFYDNTIYTGIRQ